MILLIIWKFHRMHPDQIPFQSSQVHPLPLWTPLKKKKTTKSYLYCSYTHCSMVKLPVASSSGSCWPHSGLNGRGHRWCPPRLLTTWMGSHKIVFSFEGIPIHWIATVKRGSEYFCLGVLPTLGSFLHFTL